MSRFCLRSSQLLLIIVTLVITACHKDEKAPSDAKKERNMLQKYVEDPLDKAKALKNTDIERDKEMQKQLPTDEE